MPFEIIINPLLAPPDYTNPLHDCLNWPSLPLQCREANPLAILFQKPLLPPFSLFHGPEGLHKKTFIGQMNCSIYIGSILDSLPCNSP